MSRAQALKIRAEALQKARHFFSTRNVFEIDCPALVKCAAIDTHIDSIAVDADGGYLHTSPEYCLKRLLAEGIPDCYYLGHVFRKDEQGKLHNPEFTMVEWYRKNIALDAMIQETCDFLSLFLGKLPISKISYKESFQKYAGIDYRAPTQELKKLANQDWKRSDLLHYILSHIIEPNFGKDELTVLTAFPEEEAALSTLKKINGETVAMRFEIYYQGIELANGYEELADPQALRLRFQEANEKRQSEGKIPYALDEKFLKCLRKLPPCCGVALGFDRALMLQCKANSIKQVLPFAWDDL